MEVELDEDVLDNLKKVIVDKDKLGRIKTDQIGKVLFESDHSSSRCLRYDYRLFYYFYGLCASQRLFVFKLFNYSCVLLVVPNFINYLFP